MSIIDVDAFYRPCIHNEDHIERKSQMTLKQRLKRIEKDLKFIKNFLNLNDVSCTNVRINNWFDECVTFTIWTGGRHYENSDGNIALSIDDLLALIKSPKRRILFRKFPKVS